jgi:hypothetical protein
MYAWHEGTVRFLAGMAPGDELHLGDKKDKTARVSPSGDLAWLNSLPVGPTGHDHGNCGDTVTGNCAELYTYDPDTEALQCASCNPSGAVTNASAETTIASGTGGAGDTMHLHRVLAEDGSRVFFTSGDALLPEDVNGVADAYVFDTRTARLSLLSSGSDASPSEVLENSADGSDVLFLTRERLSGWDVDSNFDLYDARIDGGLPEPPTPPPSCQGDACQPAPIQLNDPTPSSSSYRGAANQARKKAHKQKHHKKRTRKQHHKRAIKQGRTARR